MKKLTVITVHINLRYNIGVRQCLDCCDSRGFALTEAFGKPKSRYRKEIETFGSSL